MKKANKKIRSPQESLELLLDQYGSKNNLACAFGIKRQSIIKWFKNWLIPARRVMQACDLSNGKIKPNEFRPDIFRE